MKYPKDYLDEIKLRLKVSQVIGKSVKLKKRGKEYIALSPFSNEKTPSFTISDEKGFYHCFSSGEHGNIFDFLMKTKSLKFGEAVKMLAEEAGMPIYKFSKYDEEREKRWKIYTNIIKNYSDLCHEELKQEKNLKILEYLKKRGLTKNEIIFFNIGYSPFNSNFVEKLKDKFDETQIQSSGIYYFDKENKKQIDKFRGRIIFPFKNLINSTVALAGRAVSNTKQAKYINSPETEFYKKGNNLYNIHNAKQLNQTTNEVFIVEGYMDVISLYRSGIKNVVANMGTALTEKQLDLIWRFFKNPVICLDGDESGKIAALRAAEKLFPFMKSGFNIYFLTLPENMDPDNYINQNGKDSFLNFSKNKKEIQNFIWDSYYQEVDTNSPQSLALFEKKIQSVCNQIKDTTLKKYFLDNYSKRLFELTPSLNFKKNKIYQFKKIQTPLQETKRLHNQRIKFSEIDLKQYSILYLIINNLNYFCNKIELISEINFSNDLFNEFKTSLISYLISNEKNIKKKLDSEDCEKKFLDLFKNVNKFAPVKMITENKNEQSLLNIFYEILDEIKEIELNNKIQALEDKVAKEMDEKLYAELLSLKSHRKGH